ncbi:hypothetical protein MKX01_015085 [Papaver californicum]|nr:hypothetical protein MKX01_015085 [Papaver californicum]
MSKSIVVLGSAAIFFTLTLLCAQPVDGFSWGEIFIAKKNVTVHNDIDPNISLKLHCWSSDDDLGEHTLYHGQSFYWRFSINWKQTTKFQCESSWIDPNGDVNHSAEFTAYKTKRDWMKHCKHDCSWSIRRDGGYYGYPGPYDVFPYEKMFSY